MRFLQFVVAFLLLLSLTACSQWSAAYYAAQGDARLGKGDYDKAIQDYNQAISREPKLAHALAGALLLAAVSRPASCIPMPAKQSSQPPGPFC